MYHSFGELLAAKMASQAVTHKALAAACGCSVKTIFDFTNNRSIPAKTEKHALFNFLDFTEAERDQANDLIGAWMPYGLPPDVLETIQAKPCIIAAIRLTAKGTLTDKDWADFIDAVTS